MHRLKFPVLSKEFKSATATLTMVAFLFGSTLTALALDALRGGPLPQPLPLFPPDNWWNLDISNWPVDVNSPSYIAFINNGGTRRLHPDFGGDDGTQYGIYGMPYAVAGNVTNADLQPVQFQYWDESNGVDLNTGLSFHFIQSRRRRSQRANGSKAVLQATLTCAAVRIATC
jgi:hypothetical protein